ncbi:cofactor assembly of complex C subunit B [Synechocystis sp. LKSZ1]|uniref:cofactor assembly of complex C subunit B n=1 Tax=Synechocystis sp. LKSZ1 TaxID=3144951 RepID=UPI00336C1565
MTPAFDTPVLASTLFLTVISLIGLVFFIRASVKERQAQLYLPVESSAVDLLDQLKDYLLQRAYRVIAINPATQSITFEGTVSPSKFLAVFLSLMAALGLLCLALVIGTLWPEAALPSLVLLGLAPLAGLFYWRRAQRQEQVQIQVLSRPESQDPDQPWLTITGHRDELKALQAQFPLPWQGLASH